ncbi:MAG: heavy-metal-associated domain-containing protein [Methylococcaceae bacterium]|nr:heavy-metal-associated domain-containing protein [Methylococcaceae bacterium]
MTESVTIAVSGMKCGGCEANVINKLQALDGVLIVKASSKAKQVHVEFDTQKTNVDSIKTTITAAGYTVE